jgi:hypothetical protein
MVMVPMVMTMMLRRPVEMTRRLSPSRHDQTCYKDENYHKLFHNSVF